MTLQEPLAVEVDTPELEQEAAEHVVVASAQSQTAVETATTEMVDVLEIDVPEVE